MKKSKIFEQIDARTPEHIKKKVSEQFEIANKIADILAKQGKSQRDFAILMDKKESEISKWLSGSHNFTVATLSTIQEKLGERVWDISPSSRREQMSERLREIYRHRNESIKTFSVIKVYETVGVRTKRLSGTMTKFKITKSSKQVLFPKKTTNIKDQGTGFFVRVQVPKLPVKESNKYVPISMHHGKDI